MRKSLEIILNFYVNSSQLHPDLPVYIENYTMLLLLIGWIATKIRQYLNALAKAFELNVDDG